MASYQPVTQEFLAQLESIAPGRVTAGSEVNPDYGRDEMPIYGVHPPEAAVEILSTEEAAAVVKLCYAHNIPVTTRGAGTGLVGGCVPVFGGVVLSTARMNRILGYDLENFTVTVQPGVLLQQLAEDALSHGCLYPPDPGEKLATLGGNVSTNASGMRGVKYGATRDYVKAMTVVLPTGEVTQFGSAVSKTSSGYNLLHLMIGSEGTLGIITELTLKLIPAPGATISLVVPFADLPTCISTVPKLRHSHLNPQAIEFFEKEILITSETYLEKQVFPRVIEGTDVGAYLLITFDGDSMEALEPTIERAATLLLGERLDAPLVLVPVLGLVCVAGLWICQLIGRPAACGMACILPCVMLISGDVSGIQRYYYAAARVSETVVGVTVAFLINSLLPTRNPQPQDK